MSLSFPIETSSFTFSKFSKKFEAVEKSQTYLMNLLGSWYKNLQFLRKITFVRGNHWWWLYLKKQWQRKDLNQWKQGIRSLIRIRPPEATWKINALESFGKVTRIHMWRRWILILNKSDSTSYEKLQ